MAAPHHSRGTIMSNYNNDQNSIDAFADMIRDQFPEMIHRATGGEVEQVEDRELMAWTANREAAFEIFLSNSASYQIIIKQIHQALQEACSACGGTFHDDELGEIDGNLVCWRCQEHRLTPAPQTVCGDVTQTGVR